MLAAKPSATMAKSNVWVALADLMLYASLVIAAPQGRLNLGTGPSSEGSSGETKLEASIGWSSLDGLMSEKSRTSPTKPGNLDQEIAAKFGMSGEFAESSIQASQQRTGEEATKAQAVSTSRSGSSADSSGLSASLGSSSSSLSLPTSQAKVKTSTASRTSQRNQNKSEATNVASEEISELEPGARLSPVAETIGPHRVASESSPGLGTQTWPSVREGTKVSSQFTTQEHKKNRFSVTNSRQESSVNPNEIQEELPKASEDTPPRILTSSIEQLMRDDGDHATSESFFRTSAMRGPSHHRYTRSSTFKLSSSSSSSLPHDDTEESSSSSLDPESSFPSIGNLDLHHDEIASEPEQPSEHNWSPSADYCDGEQLESHSDRFNPHETTPYQDIEEAPLREHVDETYVDASDPSDPKQVRVTKEVKSVHGPNGESYMHEESKTSNSIGNSDSYGHHHHSSSSYSSSESSNYSFNNDHSTKSHRPRRNRKKNKKHNNRAKQNRNKPFQSYQPTHGGYEKPDPQPVAYPSIPSIPSMHPMMMPIPSIPPIPPVPQLPHVPAMSWPNFANKSAKDYNYQTVDSGVHPPMSQFNVGSFDGSPYGMSSSSFTQTTKHGRRFTRRQAKRMKYRHMHNRN